MSDTDARALGRAALLLLAASVVRWAWSPSPEPSALAGAAGEGVLAGLLQETAARAADAERRARPLAPGERLDPNTAPVEELDRLPGVGPATAEAIVRGREEGAYRVAEDLLRVRGVGPAMLRRIGSHLELPARGSSRPTTPSTPGGRGVERPTPVAAAAPLDLNRADTLELQTLPGVGPALARRIVESRSAEPFRSIDDLDRVRGIGPATLARLRPLVTVRR